MLYITILNKLEYIDSKLQGIYQRGGTKQMQKENKNDKRKCKKKTKTISQYH